jgi:hypothetical protein
LNINIVLNNTIGIAEAYIRSIRDTSDMLAVLDPKVTILLKFGKEGP